MNAIFIVFASRTDEELGFLEIIRGNPVRAYAEGIYEVEQGALNVLDSLNIRYRMATEEEIAAHVPGRAVRNPVAAHL
jgi:hypothetical protein